MVNITICSLLYFYVFSSVIMKLILAVLVLVLVIETQAQWHQYPGQAIGGHLFFLLICIYS